MTVFITYVHRQASSVETLQSDKLSDSSSTQHFIRRTHWFKSLVTAL